MTALGKVINKYQCRSFKIKDYHAESEIDKAKLKDLCNLETYMSMADKITSVLLRYLYATSKKDSDPNAMVCRTNGSQSYW